MNLKLWAPLVLAAILGVVAAKVGRDMVVKSRAAQNAAAATLVKIVVAARDVDPGTTLSESDLKLATIAASAVPPSAFRELSQAVGRVTGGPLGAGQVLFDAVLAPQAKGDGIAEVWRHIAELGPGQYFHVGGHLVPFCQVSDARLYAQLGLGIVAAELLELEHHDLKAVGPEIGAAEAWGGLVVARLGFGCSRVQPVAEG